MRFPSQCSKMPRKLEKGAGGRNDDVGTEKQVKKFQDDGSQSVTSGGTNGSCEESGLVDALDEQLHDRWTMDWQALRRIFPDEVWLIIMDCIKDPVTLECLSNASPVFREIILPRRVQFLFHSVWNNVLGSKYHKEALNFNGDKAYTEEPNRCHVDSSQLPSTSYNNDLIVTRWCTGILKLRMVCRTWCDAVDYWYQNHQCHYKMTATDRVRDAWQLDQYDPDLLPISNWAQDTFSISSEDNLELFRAHFESTHSVDGVAVRNPFLGRAVEVSLEDLDGSHEPYKQFLDLLRELLSKYGRHIWYLTLHIEDCFPTRVACYSAIRSLIQATPNLKVFRLSYDAPSDHWFPNDIVPPHELPILKSHITLHSLPRLDSLKFLTIRKAGCMPSQFFHELIRSSGNLSMLQMGYHSDSFEHYDVSTGTVPNLRELSVMLRSRKEMETFFAGRIGWQMSKLYLELDRATLVEWGWLFQQLRVKWGNTLNTLILQLPCIDRMEDQNKLLEFGGDLQLNLPRLSHLKLIMRSLCCLDFLLPMKNTLQILELQVTATVQREAQGGLVNRLENGKRIQLLSSPDNPMESNIWTLFPKLKHMQFDYNYSSRSEVRKCRFFSARTSWSVARDMWQNWNNGSSIYRRNKSESWKIVRESR